MLLHGVYFNFLIGVFGRILSDVPVNVTVHGASSTLAFHYTIMVDSSSRSSPAVLLAAKMTGAR